MLIDTHCHIFDEYYEDIDDVIKRAIDNDVNMIVVNGYNRKSNEEVLELIKKYDIVYGALGIQPEEIDDYNVSNLKFIEDHINDDKIIAVGEIGLDYYYDIDRNRQIELFKRQLQIAAKYNKPVIVHSRDAIQDTYNILKVSHVKGIMHCYSGSVEMAREFNKIGFLLGIGGISTFKNARKLLDVIRCIDLKYFVLETDSPYLAPVPYRGKRNEPAYIKVILEKICDLKGLDYKEVEKVIYLNTMQLFDKNMNL
ncbi:MAG: TatD family hydrolase [Bacilli bacterium]|nr:TatD family hydrolase [Bacilli bacterium]